jgi:asparagine N-glycosylation enzyme membrane subunit Stt3
VWISLLSIVVLAILIRVIPQWSTVIEDGQAVIRDPDACYHLRRAEIMAYNPPDLAITDSYINYPHGGRVIWPPLYDLSLAAILRVLPAGDSLRGPSWRAAMVPPLLFAGVVALTFVLARRRWPQSPGNTLLAALVAALLPATVPYTSLGLLDHHAAELLSTLGFVLAWGRGLGRSRAGASPWRAGLLPGVVLAAALLIQLTLVVLIPVALVALLFGWRRGQARDLDYTLATFGWAAALVVPWSAAYAVAGAPVRHFQFGLFQPGVLAVAGLAVAAARLRLAPGGAYRLPALAAVGSVLLALLIWVVPEGLRGLSFITGSFTPWVSTIGESRSLLDASPARAWREVSSLLSPLLLLVPIAAVIWARAARRDDALAAILFAAAFVFVPLALMQARFFPHLVPLVALATPTVATLLTLPGRWSVVRPVAVWGLVVVSLALTWPAWRYTEEAATAFDRVRPLLGFLATQTPATSYYERPVAQPEYCVVAPWSYGHFIQYHGRRPVAVDNFGDHAGDLGVVRSCLLATDDRRAHECLAALGARYVLVADLTSTFTGLVPTAEQIDRFIVRVGPERDGRREIEFSSSIAETVLYRLAWRSGTGVFDRPDGRVVPSLSHFRLVAESDSLESIGPGVTVPYMKLYEIVAGARLQLAGRQPGEQGALFAAVRSPAGNVFPFVNLVTADASGIVEATVPYPTAAAPGASRLERCELRTGDDTFPVRRIEETAVRSGAVVTVE